MNTKDVHLIEIFSENSWPHLCRTLMGRDLRH